MMTIIFGLLGGFILIRMLLQWFAQGSLILEFATFISCVGAIALALALAWFVESHLKQTWSSGQEFELSADGLRYEGGVKDNGQPDVRVVEFDKRVNLTRWFFRLTGYPKAGRERLVSDKSVCLAVQIQQDGERITAFSYLPPVDASEWLDNPDLDRAVFSKFRLPNYIAMPAIAAGMGQLDPRSHQRCSLVRTAVIGLLNADVGMTGWN